MITVSLKLLLIFAIPDNARLLVEPDTIFLGFPLVTFQFCLFLKYSKKSESQNKYKDDDFT